MSPPFTSPSAGSGVSVSVDDRALGSALASYLAATRRGARDVNLEVGKRFANIVLKQTPPLVGKEKRKDATKGTPKGTRKAHTEFLRRRILGMRLPRGRLTRSMMRDRHMSKKQAKAYFKVASQRQGEMLSGWNALARWVGKKPAGWISRHGEKHGSVVSTRGSETRLMTTTIIFRDNSKGARRFNLERFARQALARVAHGLETAAKKIVARRLREARRSRA